MKQIKKNPQQEKLTWQNDENLIDQLLTNCWAIEASGGKLVTISITCGVNAGNIRGLSFLNFLLPADKRANYFVTPLSLIFAYVFFKIGMKMEQDNNPQQLKPFSGQSTINKWDSWDSTSQSFTNLEFRNQLITLAKAYDQEKTVVDQMPSEFGERKLFYVFNINDINKLKSETIFHRVKLEQIFNNSYFATLRNKRFPTIIRKEQAPLIRDQLLEEKNRRLSRLIRILVGFGFSAGVIASMYAYAYRYPYAPGAVQIRNVFNVLNQNVSPAALEYYKRLALWFARSIQPRLQQLQERVLLWRGR